MHQIRRSPANSADRYQPKSSSLADFLSRQRRNKPVQVDFPHPLTWWRTRSAQSFKFCEIYVARRILIKSAIIGEPHWLAGARGDAATAIGVALRVRRQKGLDCICNDLAMTAVLCVALEGNAAAALLLSATLKAMAVSDPSIDTLSSSWLLDPQKNSSDDEQQPNPGS